MPLKSLATALQFLTNIKIKKSLADEKSLAGSTPYFPLIGILIGCFLAGTYLIFIKFFPAGVVSALIVISSVVITRGLHIDGLIDTVDGLFGGSTGEERLKIMKDTRVGSFGVAALVCLILLKFTLVLEILNIGSATSIILILILAPALSRWCMVCAMYFFTYAKAEGTGHFTKFAGAKEVVIASIIMIIFCIGLLKSAGLILLVCTFIFMLLISKYISSKIGGMTGDTYGALNEFAEAFVLMVYLFLISSPVQLL